MLQDTRESGRLLSSYTNRFICMNPNMMDCFDPKWLQSETSCCSGCIMSFFTGFIGTTGGLPHPMDQKLGESGQILEEFTEAGCLKANQTTVTPVSIRSEVSLASRLGKNHPDPSDLQKPADSVSPEPDKMRRQLVYAPPQIQNKLPKKNLRCVKTVVFL